MTSDLPDPTPRPPDNPVPGDPVPPPAPPDIPPAEPPPDLPGPGPDETPPPAPPETEPPSIPEEVPRGGSALSRAFLLCAALLLGGGVTAAVADMEVSPEAPETRDRDDPCRVAPTPPGGGGNGERARPALEDCNGVLAPPRTGDEEIEEPPPDTGTTPVIPPETLPEPQPEPEPE